MSDRFRFAYPATLTPDDGAICVDFPDVPEAHSFGADEAEALEQAVDALTVALSLYVDDGRDIPRPSRPKRRQPVVALPSLAATKLAIYQAMRDQGVSVAALGRRMKIDRKNVRRILDLDHQSTIEQLEAALAALGKELVIEVRDAA
jgi:antitoxin HicB